MKLRFLDRIEIEDRKVKLIYAFYDTALLYQIQLGLENPAKADPIPPWMTQWGHKEQGLAASSDLGVATCPGLVTSTGHRQDSSMENFSASDPAPFPSDLFPPAVDVVVIGAGHDGLVAAGYLAKAGLRVAVVEAADNEAGWRPRLWFRRRPANRHFPRAGPRLGCPRASPPISSCGNAGSSSSSPTRLTCRSIPTGRHSHSGAITRAPQPRSRGTRTLTPALFWSSPTCSM